MSYHSTITRALLVFSLSLSVLLSGCVTPSGQNTSTSETTNSMQQEPISSDISSSTSDSDPQHSSLPEIVPLQNRMDMSGVDTGKMVSITFALLEDPTALVILCMQTIQVGKFFIYAHKQTAHITIPPAPAILFPAPAVFLPW